MMLYVSLFIVFSVIIILIWIANIFRSDNRKQEIYFMMFTLYSIFALFFILIRIAILS